MKVDFEVDAAAGLPESYLDLVRKFPLYSIADEAHCEQATKVMEGLLQMSLDAGGQAYLDALTDLIDIFEAPERLDVSGINGRDVLAELFASSGLSQAQFAREIGIGQSTVSALLNGSRDLNIDHITRLAKFFGLPTSAFLPG